MYNRLPSSARVFESGRRSQDAVINKINALVDDDDNVEVTRKELLDLYRSISAMRAHIDELEQIVQAHDLVCKE